jgi:hypothetical protein
VCAAAATIAKDSRPAQVLLYLARAMGARIIVATQPRAIPPVRPPVRLVISCGPKLSLWRLQPPNPTHVTKLKPFISYVVTNGYRTSPVQNSNLV